MSRSKRCGTRLGLPIIAASCLLGCVAGCGAGFGNWARSDVESENSSFSGDEKHDALPIPAVGPTIREPYCIEITGNNYRWRVRYPDADGGGQQQGGGSISRDVHVPLQTDVVLVLKSDDYVYTVTLPKFGLKEIAVPSLEFRMEFRSSDAGRFPLLGDQLCGDPHPELQGDLIVESREHFLQWLKDQQRGDQEPEVAASKALLSSRGTSP